MTWETVAQVLVLAVGATGVSRWLSREPRAEHRSVDVLAGRPPRGHQYAFVVTYVRCDCGWRWDGGDFTTQARLRRELRRHLESVDSRPEPSPPRASLTLPATYSAGSRYYLPTRNLGDPQNYCGRGLCALGAGHSGSCTT